MMGLDPDARALADLFDAGCAGFNARDIDAYFASVHEAAWTYQLGAFAHVATFREEVAPSLLDSGATFRVSEWLGGVVVDDTGIVWGIYEGTMPEPDGGTTTSTGSFSAHGVRRDGAWQFLFTHYTPASA